MSHEIKNMMVRAGDNEDLSDESALDWAESRIDTLTAERDEQLRLNQIGQEREARLMAERDEMRASEVRVKAEIARLEMTNVILQGIIVELNDQHTEQ